MKPITKSYTNLNEVDQNKKVMDVSTVRYTNVN